MIGAISAPLETIRVRLSTDSVTLSPSDTLLTLSSIYGYDTNGYSAAGSIRPGMGYWLKVSNDGYLLYNYDTTAQAGRPLRNAYMIYTGRRPCPPDGLSDIPAPALLEPPNGISGRPSLVRLGWLPGFCSGKYHLKLSSSPTFETSLLDSFVLAETLWVGGLVSGTTYYWQVADSTDSVGIGPWSLVRSFIVGVPDAPLLLAPLNLAEGQPLAVPFFWSWPDGALSFHFQLSTDSSFGTIAVDDSSLTGTLRSVSGLAIGTTYYWRVSARNSLGEGPWSQVRSFTTGMPPGAVVLAAPATGAINQPAALTFGWYTTQTTTRYHLELSSSQSFSSCVVNDSMLIDTLYETSGLANLTTYYWRVRAVNDFGTSDWSTVSSFTTGPAPDAPTLAGPASGSTGISYKPTLSWNPVANATSYRLDVSRSSVFTPVLYNYSCSDTAQQVDSLDGNLTYYWRVYAANIAGTSPAGDVWNFTTEAIPAPATPTLLSPANNATGIYPTCKLNWNGVSYGMLYYVQVSTTSSFSSFVVNDSTSGLSRNLTNLSAFRKYYWRIKARNNCGQSNWSQVWNFTTGDNCPIDSLESSPLSMDALTLRDASGYSQTLYVYNGSKVLAADLARKNEMPPEPAQGIFSARFGSNRFFEPVRPSASGQGNVHLPPIVVKGAQYPLTLSWDIKTRNNIRYWLPDPVNHGHEIMLEHTGSRGFEANANGRHTILLTAQSSSIGCGDTLPEGKTVARRPSNGEEETESTLPKEFALRQNAPNPFNPITVINYELPSDAMVELKVYNMLGQEVATFVNTIENAGYHSTTFNASNVASGVYFYRFKATPLSNGEQGKDFVRIMKMVLLK